jgi:hypothetical protein
MKILKFISVRFEFFIWFDLNRLYNYIYLIKTDANIYNRLIGSIIKIIFFISAGKKYNFKRIRESM